MIKIFIVNITMIKIIITMIKNNNIIINITMIKATKASDVSEEAILVTGGSQVTIIVLIIFVIINILFIIITTFITEIINDGRAGQKICRLSAPVS